MRETIKTLSYNLLMNFRKLCEEVAENLGVDVMFFDDSDGADVVEDDGTLHVTRRGLRACFDVGEGQTHTRSQQNAVTRRVLKALGFKKVSPRALV